VNTNFHQYYNCSGEQYFNLWQIYDKHLNDLVDGYKHIEYVVDQDLIATLKGIKKPTYDKRYIQSLMVRQLKKLRNKYNKLRLLYSGGTDSFTILKLAIENDIYIDETITHLVSLQNDKKTNIEYLHGIAYAQKHCPNNIGRVTLIHPTLQDLDYYYTNDWHTDESIVRGCPIWLRGQYICRYMPPALDEDTVTLTGQEKPQLIKQDNKVYWCVLDDPMSEYMKINSIYHFFCDKNNPELIAAQVYAFLNTVKLKEGYNNTDSYQKDTRLDLIENLGYYLTGKSFIDKALIGKNRFNQSIKNKRFLKELFKQGHEDLTNQIFQNHKNLYNKYKNIKHGIEYHNGFVKSVGRYSQKIQVFQDSFAG